MGRPKASVIVLTWNGVGYVEKCLTAVFSQDYPALEVIVVDNGSTDGTADLVAERFPQVRLIRNGRNLGFATGNNMGLQAASGDLLVLLNQDTEAQAGFLQALAGTFDDPGVGVVGCKLLYPDGTIQHAGGYLYGPRAETGHVGRHAPDDGRFDQVADADFVTAAALSINRACLERVGFLDEGFEPAYYEDVDWCYRARTAGFRVVYQPGAVVIHHESTATTEFSYDRKYAWNHGRIRFVFKHWPLDRLLGEFGPAESAWVASMSRITELMAARRACLDVLLALPEIVDFRAGSLDEAQDLIRLLVDLRASALASLEDRPALSGLTAVERGAPPEPDVMPQEAASRRPPGPQPGLLTKLRRAWAGLRYLDVLPDLVNHVQQHEAKLAQYGHSLEQHDQRLQGQRHDVAENIRELTTLAERLARQGQASPGKKADG
jgi:GT2 family glycosyltransferase